MMELTSFQKEMLDGKYGKGKAMALEILVGIGESFDAKRLVPIERAHISLSAQGADRWFAEKMAESGAYCAIKPTVNPGYSICFFKNKDLLSEEGEENMVRVHNAYKKLGATLTYSCTPYMFINVPKYRETLSFSETSVTIYANSVVGARTNRESSFSSLCSAITGFTPEYGFLLDENRYGDVIVNVEANLVDDFDFALLGMMGKKIGSGVPIFTGIKNSMSTSAHINLGTQLNVSGSFTLYHVLGMTPEAKTLEMATGGKEVRRYVTITQEDIDEIRREYYPKEELDFVILGCPHYTYNQILEVLSQVKENKPKIPVLILTSQGLIAFLDEMGLKKELEELGVELVPDTCVDQEYVFGHLKNKNGVSDSPKCSYYMSTFGVNINVCSVKECLDLAHRGGVV